MRRAALSDNAYRGIAETVLASYGGSILVPMLLGINPFPLANDLAVPCAAVVYLLVKKILSPAISDFIENMAGVKLMLACCFEAVRCKVLIVWLSHANRTIAPSYFSYPLVGPIVCGTLAGCAGAFIVGGGLQALSAGPSWAMVSAFLASCFFHAFVNCLGWMPSRDASAVCAVFLIVAHVKRIVSMPPLITTGSKSKTK